MQKLRRLHLYFGVFFAPMLLFFAVSGLWQTFRLNDRVPVLKTLSMIHTLGHSKGSGWQPTSIYLELFVVLMALGLILSIITGIVLAFKFGRGRAALVSLAAGIVIPAVVVLFLGS